MRLSESHAILDQTDDRRGRKKMKVGGEGRMECARLLFPRPPLPSHKHGIKGCAGRCDKFFGRMSGQLIFPLHRMRNRVLILGACIRYIRQTFEGHLHCDVIPKRRTFRPLRCSAYIHVHIFILSTFYSATRPTLDRRANGFFPFFSFLEGWRALKYLWRPWMLSSAGCGVRYIWRRKQQVNRYGVGKSPQARYLWMDVPVGMPRVFASRQERRTLN